jgi:hypothetical protein
MMLICLKKRNIGNGVSEPIVPVQRPESMKRPGQVVNGTLHVLNWSTRLLKGLDVDVRGRFKCQREHSNPNDLCIAHKPCKACVPADRH